MVRMSFQPALLSLLKRSKCSMRSIKTCRARPSCRKILIAKKRLPGPHGSSPSSVDGADTLPISRQDPLHSTMAWPVSRLSPADGLSKMCRCPSANAGHPVTTARLWKDGVPQTKSCAYWIARFRWAMTSGNQTLEAEHQMSEEATAVLAEFAASLTYEAIPERVRACCKDLLLDALACAVAGHAGEETHQLAALSSALAQSRESTVIGGDRLSLAGATMLNGYLITAVTMCDAHRP